MVPRRAVFTALCSAVSVVIAQEEATLPVWCQTDATYPPGSSAPAFSVPVTSGAVLHYPGASLPLITFAVDSETDPGGLLLATDAIELDHMFSDMPPATGTILFLSYMDGGGARIAAILEARLGLQPPLRAVAWRARLFVASQSLEALRAAGNAIASVIDSWPAPRTWVGVAGTTAPLWPRVDGFYECYGWPAAHANFSLVGPVTACTSSIAIDVPAGAVLLVLNASGPEGTCDADKAAVAARSVAPTAAGAVISAAVPTIVGRGCDDVFYDTPFFPFVVDADAGTSLAARLALGPVNISISADCGGGTWFAIGADGALAQPGWRKYTEAGALRWTLDALLYKESVVTTVHTAAASVVILPPGSVLNAAVSNVTFASPAELRRYTGAALDLTLTCPGGVTAGDGPCGAWDRIISATAVCASSVGAGLGATAPYEITRWITPFRRATGRWLTDASPLLAMVANGSAVPSGIDDVPWTCTIAVTSCCEPWEGTLVLHLFNSSLSEGAAGGSGTVSIFREASAVARNARPAAIGTPFAIIPLEFPNSQTHFGPGYNANRTVRLTAPSGASRAVLIALITGHGSDPPPPLAQGCEYAPTSHTFSFVPADSPHLPTLVVNTSAVAGDQYMGAGSALGCANRVAEGVIDNSHGDWRDGEH